EAARPGNADAQRPHHAGGRRHRRGRARPPDRSRVRRPADGRAGGAAARLAAAHQGAHHRGRAAGAAEHGPDGPALDHARRSRLVRRPDPEPRAGRQRPAVAAVHRSAREARPRLRRLVEPAQLPQGRPSGGLDGQRQRAHCRIAPRGEGRAWPPAQRGPERGGIRQRQDLSHRRAGAVARFVQRHCRPVAFYAGRQSAIGPSHPARRPDQCGQDRRCAPAHPQAFARGRHDHRGCGQAGRRDGRALRRCMQCKHAGIFPQAAGRKMAAMSARPPQPLRRLPTTLVNRIAAGEVVERPASAVKELVENAIDAGARRIAVTLKEGGRSFIAVVDDGSGMSAAELGLAVERHCTSNLPNDDLSDIRTPGFRGEALPSIASVSRSAITSRAAGADDAWTLEIEGGAKGEPRPAAHAAGTRVEVRDLFFATPARLKFLKEPRTEASHVADALRRLAMAHPVIAFRLESEERTLIDLPAASASLLDKADVARLARLSAIMGRDFADNVLPIDANREGFRLTGFAGLPTLNRPTSQHQYLFVNGRPVRDKLLAGAVRGAYQDFLARDRHPMVALFLEAPANLVDVNVHPAKTEVRFRDPGIVRGLIVGALRTALAAAGHRASTTVAHAALGALRPHTGTGTALPLGSFGGNGGSASLPRRLAQAAAPFMARLAEPSARVEAAPEAAAGNGGTFPLGVARAQLHETYIVAQTEEGVVIVDQHAAHERLLHERLKDQLQADGVK